MTTYLASFGLLFISLKRVGIIPKHFGFHWYICAFEHLYNTIAFFLSVIPKDNKHCSMFMKDIH